MINKNTSGKLIRFNAIDGVYQLPVEAVAAHRADYYAKADGFDKQSEEYREEYRLCLTDSFEAVDWLLGNMDYSDVKDQSVKIANEIRLKHAFWTCSEDFEIVEVTDELITV